MVRNRASAKKAGSSFERLVADYIGARLKDSNIDRSIKRGSKDRGDIAGLRFNGKPVAIECKNTSRISLSEWIKEARVEAENLGAPFGVVVHKRRGTTDPSLQYVTMTLENLVDIIEGGQ